eukprot:335361-Pelagomonas_calceolata.AAC.1
MRKWISAGACARDPIICHAIIGLKQILVRELIVRERYGFKNIPLNMLLVLFRVGRHSTIRDLLKDLQVVLG